MKCPHCGAWNKAYLPKCTGCGAPLQDNTQKQASWEEAMHKKKPSLTVMQFDPEDKSPAIPEASGEEAFDPEELNAGELTDEMEELKERRREGSMRLEQMKAQAQNVRRSLQEAEVLRPVPEAGDIPYSADSVVIRRRQQQRQTLYTDNLAAQEEDDAVYADAQDGYDAYDAPGERLLTYVNDDEDAPIYYDGFIPESGDQDALTDEEYMPRRIQSRQERAEAHDTFNSGRKKSSRIGKILIGSAAALVSLALVGVYLRRASSLSIRACRFKRTTTRALRSQRRPSTDAPHTP